jgi:hypothetical protein
MSTYICPFCGNGVASGRDHDCKPKSTPFNVLNEKKCSHGKGMDDFCYRCWKEQGGAS